MVNKLQQKAKKNTTPDSNPSINKLLSTLAYGLIAIIGLQYIAQDLIAPLLMAIFLTILFIPVFSWFRNKGFSRGLSLVLMFVTLVIGGGLIIWFLSWSFGLLAESLSVYIEGFKQTLAHTAKSLNIDSSTTEQVTNKITPDSITNLISTVVGSLGWVMMYLIIVPILAILILLQIDSIPKKSISSLMKANPSLKRYKKFADTIMIYLAGRVKVNIVTGLLFAIALTILKVPYAFVWGIVAVFLAFIPYVGLMLGAIIPTLLAFAINGPINALLVFGSNILITTFTENVLDPYVQSKATKISTASVVIAIIFFTWLLGPLGAIMAVPLLVLVKLILADYQDTAWLASIMEGNMGPQEVKKGKSFLTKTTEKAKALISKIK